jgi:hypothetical protein
VLRHPGVLAAPRRASVTSALRRAPLSPALRRAALRSAPSLRRPALALSEARYAEAVRWLKLAAGALAGATVALAIVNNYQASNEAVPAYEPVGTETVYRNQTIVYRQAPSDQSYARAVQVEASVYEEDQAEPYAPRAVQTVRFVNPSPQEIKGASAPAPSESGGFKLAAAGLVTAVMTKVSGFVAFSGKATAPDAADTAEPGATTSMVRPGFPQKRGGAIMDEVDDYLWEVYQREPIKKDGAGDFTWKDPAAAKRLNMPLQNYVIGGMDPEFREALYHAGKAMDEAGIQWTLLSAFRDDYRQGIATGFKARVGNSLHGGSRATGGYGHGRAVDVIGRDGTSSDVWKWIDAHGAKYGIYRPIPGPDPAHVQSRGDWRKLAVALRQTRVGVADATGALGTDIVLSKGTPTRKSKIRVAHSRR